MRASEGAGPEGLDASRHGARCWPVSCATSSGAGAIPMRTRRAARHVMLRTALVMHSTHRRRGERI